MGKTFSRSLAAWVVVGTLPIVAAGLLLKGRIEAWHEGSATLWFDFLLTALLLARASLVKEIGRASCRERV